MKNFSEVIKIIEGGLEGNRTKVIAYANLLTNKVNERQSQMIIERITGEYKKKKVLGFWGVEGEKRMNFQCMECGKIVDCKETHTLLECIKFLKAELEELQVKK